MPSLARLILCTMMLAACGGAPPAPPATGDLNRADPSTITGPEELDRSRPARLVLFGLGEAIALCAVTDGGGVICWGPAWHYDLLPHRIEGLADIVELTASGMDVCARAASGGVTCFSRRTFSNELDVVTLELDDAVDLEVLGERFCAARSSGRVVCWGGAPASRGPRSHAYLGDDGAWATLDETSGLDGAVALRAAVTSRRGDTCWCALRRSGRVHCWGSCPLPGAPEADEPGPDEAGFELARLSEVSDLELGAETSCIVQRGGGVLCTGQTAAGAPPPLVIVRPTAQHARAAPEGWVEMEDTAGVTELSWRRGRPTRCGTNDGTEHCWDTRVAEEEETPEWLLEAEEEELQGLDSDAAFMPETLEANVVEVRELEGGGCATVRDGGVRCWGVAPNGGGRRDLTARPIRVAGIDDATAIAADEGTTCVIDARARVLCWGQSELNSIDGGSHRFETPHHVPDLDGAVEVLVGHGSICARRRSGEVRCRGRLAQTSTEREPTTARAVPYLRGASSLWLGHDLCGIRRGSIRCNAFHIGFDEEGQTTRGIRSYEIPELSGVTTLGDRFAQLEDGSLSAFVTDPDQPTLRPVPTRAATALSRLYGRPCVFHEAQLACWGRDADAHEDSWLELQVGALTQFDGDEHHGCGVREDGRVVCWGFNTFGQMGRLPIGREYDPFVVEGIEGARQVAVGEHHTCSIAGEGAVFCWGRNDYGQLGVSEPIAPPLPEVVTVPEVP